jgi:hypothetical protein
MERFIEITAKVPANVCEIISLLFFDDIKKLNKG